MFADFADQCSVLRNKSAIFATLLKETHESLTIIDFSDDDILKIITNFDPNKAYCHDVISIRVVKIRDDSVCKPFKTSL